MENAIREYKKLFHLKNSPEYSKIFEDVLDTNMTRQEQIILDNYPNKIWQASDGRWKTKLPNDQKQLVAKSTREKLEKAIIDFYIYDKEHKRNLKKKNNPTLKSLYPDWLSYMDLKSNSYTYASRLDCDWRRYYLNDPIIDIPIKNLNKIMLEEWAYRKIKNGSERMTKTQYYNMSTIIRGILDYAIDLELIKENLYRSFTIKKGQFRKPAKKAPETQVYSNIEKPQIIELAEAEYKKYGYTACLAICLNFYLGLRIGELMALKESDREGNYVVVQRQEIRRQIQSPDGHWKTTGYDIDDYLKSDKDERRLFLSTEAKKYWDMIIKHNKDHNYDGEYLLIHNGKHIHYPAVNKRLSRYCRILNITPKSNHKIRKTVLSMMVDEVGLDEAMSWGGHSHKTTLLKNYHFTRRTVGQTEWAIQKAFRSKSVTECNQITDIQKKPGTLVG